MAQRINVEDEYADALVQVRATTMDGRAPGPLPGQCPFTLDALLSADRDVLEAQLQAKLHADRNVV